MKAGQGVVESWEVMMGIIEKMRTLDRNGGKSKGDREEEWEESEKGEWESAASIPSEGLGRGYSTLSMRLGQVRTGDWGMMGRRGRVV